MVSTMHFDSKAILYIRLVHAFISHKILQEEVTDVPYKAGMYIHYTKDS